MSSAAIRNGVPAQTLWLSYSLYGDADLNGTVNALDLIPVALNYNKTGRRWDQGGEERLHVGEVHREIVVEINFGASTPTSSAPVISPMQCAAPAVVSAYGKSRNSKAKLHPHRRAPVVGNFRHTASFPHFHMFVVVEH